MKNQKLLKNLAGVACLAIVSSATARAQTLIDFNIAPDGSAETAAVLGTATDTYNNVNAGSFSYFGAGTTLVSNAVSSSGATTGVSISTSTGFNVYVDSSATTSPNPAFLMDGYAFNETNPNSGFTLSATTAFTLAGLTGYDGDAFTLVVYGAGNNPGEGDNFALTGASTATGSTSGANRNVFPSTTPASTGQGVAYQTFTGTVSGDTLTITAAPNDVFANDNGGNTEVNGFQLELNPAATPEPSTWAMMFGGLGLLVAIGRFRNRLQA